jgi:hypothetical protein
MLLSARALGSAVAVAAAVTVPLGPAAPPARADSSKLGKEWIVPWPKGAARAKQKQCCGYPLSESRGFVMHFYWLAFEEDHADDPIDAGDADVYTPRGFFLGNFPWRFVRAMRMEGSAVLSDGRVVNYAGRCRFGVGTCFEQLDRDEFPYGRGAGRRTLIPFHSVAVDPRLVRLGEPLYVPELDGLPLPDGSVHDGCVRADDTGGNIKQKELDFFVVTRDNFRSLIELLYGGDRVTPHIEAPRCAYLRLPP